MDRWKAEQGRGREKRKIRRKKGKKKEDADAWKGRKVAKHCVFPMIWGSGGSKSRLAKVAGAEPAGQMRDEKMHAVVTRSRFWSEKVQNTWCSEHFWKLRCRKSARRCGAKHISKSKCTKHLSVGPLLEAQMSFRVAGARDCAACQKASKTWGFCSISKKDGKHGTSEDDLQRCIFRGRRGTKDMFMREVGRSGRWFPERGYILGYQKCRFAKMILRDRCSTSYDLASIFRGRRSALDRWSRKSRNALARGCQRCTDLSIFEGSLAEFFRFWCLDLRKMRKSRRIASFRILSSSKNEDISQNCFVLDVVMFKH